MYLKLIYHLKKFSSRFYVCTCTLMSYHIDIGGAWINTIMEHWQCDKQQGKGRTRRKTDPSATVSAINNIYTAWELILQSQINPHLKIEKCSWFWFVYSPVGAAFGYKILGLRAYAVEFRDDKEEGLVWWWDASRFAKGRVFVSRMLLKHKKSVTKTEIYMFSLVI
jgi:hypothetical protein